MVIKGSLCMKFPDDVLVNNYAVGELCPFYLVVRSSNTHCFFFFNTLDFDFSGLEQSLFGLLDHVV